MGMKAVYCRIGLTKTLESQVQVIDEIAVVSVVEIHKFSEFGAHTCRLFGILCFFGQGGVFAYGDFIGIFGRFRLKRCYVPRKSGHTERQR